jgi:uncharacterized protein YuzE
VRFELDPVADAAYVYVAERPIAATRALDPQRLVDYDAAGEIIGLEFLAVHRGVDLHDLPYRQRLSRFFGEHQIRVFA